MEQPVSLAVRSRWNDAAALLVLSLIWGSAFALIKIAVVDIPPFMIAAGRIVLAALVLLTVQAIIGPPLADLLRPPFAARWRQFLILGMLGNGIPFVLIAYGEIRIESGLAAILIGTMPLFTLAFAHLFRVERGLTPRAWSGIALGFTGLIVLIGPAALTGLGAGGGQEIAAQLAVVLAGASYAATAVYGRVLSLAMPVSVIASGSMTASALVMLPLALVIDQPWTLRPGFEAIMAVILLGVLATAVASLIYFRLLRSAGPTFASLINYLIPAFGFVLGAVWLGEPVGWREVMALALILAALGLVRGRSMRAAGVKPAIAEPPPRA